MIIKDEQVQPKENKAFLEENKSFIQWSKDYDILNEKAYCNFLRKTKIAYSWYNVKIWKK